MEPGDSASHRGRAVGLFLRTATPKRLKIQERLRIVTSWICRTKSLFWSEESLRPSADFFHPFAQRRSTRRSRGPSVKYLDSATSHSLGRRPKGGQVTQKNSCGRPLVTLIWTIKPVKPLQRCSGRNERGGLPFYSATSPTRKLGGGTACRTASTGVEDPSCRRRWTGLAPLVLHPYCRACGEWKTVQPSAMNRGVSRLTTERISLKSLLGAKIHFTRGSRSRHFGRVVSRFLLSRGLYGKIWKSPISILAYR